MSAPTRLADSIERRVQAAFETMLPEQGVITALDVSRRSATVDVAGQARVYGYLGSSYTPAVGDVVWIGGPPDTRHILGRVNNSIRPRERLEGAVVDVALSRRSTPPDGGRYRFSVFSENPDGSYTVGSATELSNTPQGYPQVRAPEQDVGLTFFGGAVYVSNFDNSANRPLFASAVTCGDLHGTGLDVRPGGVYCGGLEVGGGGIVNYGGYSGAGPSERRLKRDILPVEESHLDAVASAPIQHWRYLPEVGGDELDSEQWRRGPMADDLPADCLMSTELGTAPEMTGMLHRAWGAVGELAAKVYAQQHQIDALSARLDALEAR